MLQAKTLPKIKGGRQCHHRPRAALRRSPARDILHNCGGTDHLAILRICNTRVLGAVAERSKAVVLKTIVRESVPWVRIPPAPPLAPTKAFSRSGYGRIFSLFSKVMRERLCTGPSAV